LAAATAAVRMHEREHLLRGARVLAVDDAARLLLERPREALVRVIGPLDHVERALSLADRRRRAAATAGAAATAAATTAARHECERRCDGRHGYDRHARPLGNRPHVPSLVISYVCSGRHERRTRFPCSASASCEDVSRFCLTTTSTPPLSRSTT